MPKAPTPPSGYPLIGEWEDSEVREIPTTRMPTSPGGIMPPRAASARQALAKIEELSQRFDDHAEMDRVQLNNIGASMTGVQADVRSLSSHVGNLREGMARVGTLTDEINTTLKQQNQREHLELVADTEIEVATKKSEIDLATDAKKFRRELIIKVIAILAPVFTALGGAIALLAQSC